VTSIPRGDWRILRHALLREVELYFGVDESRAIEMAGVPIMQFCCGYWPASNQTADLQAMKRLLIALDDAARELGSLSPEARELLEELGGIPELSRPAVEEARRRLSHLPSSRSGTGFSRTNWSEIIMVDACAGIWVAAGRPKAPRKINGGEAFAVFLQRMFNTAGLSGKIETAVNGWTRELSRGAHRGAAPNCG
jgi:hypothetical protein